MDIEDKSNKTEQEFDKAFLLLKASYPFHSSEGQYLKTTQRPFLCSFCNFPSFPLFVISNDPRLLISSTITWNLCKLKYRSSTDPRTRHGIARIGITSEFAIYLALAREIPYPLFGALLLRGRTRGSGSFIVAMRH